MAHQRVLAESGVDLMLNIEIGSGSIQDAMVK
jgi:hypothetical protein